MFRPLAIALAAALMLAWSGSGCSRERTRVIEEPAAAHPDGRDYRAMIERVRARQSPIQAQQELENAIRRFQHDFARLPTNLMELVARRYIPELRAPPEGHVYSYDPVYGNVAVIPIADEAAMAVPKPELEFRRLQLIEPSLPSPSN